MTTSMVPDFETPARKHGIRLLLQFGSTVSGRDHAHSDVDEAVLLEHPPGSLHDYGAIAAALQPCFPGRELELAIINRADPLFLKTDRVRGPAALRPSAAACRAENLSLQAIPGPPPLPGDGARVHQTQDDTGAMTVDPQLVTRKLTLILADLGTVHELALAVIDRSSAEHLAPSAGLRNRLVQEYDEIDPARVSMPSPGRRRTWSSTPKASRRISRP